MLQTSKALLKAACQKKLKNFLPGPAFLFYRFLNAKFPENLILLVPCLKNTL